MSYSSIHIPDQEPSASFDGARRYYGEKLLGERVLTAKIEGCFLLIPWRLRGKRVTAFLECYDRTATIAPGYIRYKGRYIAGTVKVCEVTESFNKYKQVVGFEPSAEHLDSFE